MPEESLANYTYWANVIAAVVVCAAVVYLLNKSWIHVGCLNGLLVNSGMAPSMLKLYAAMTAVASALVMFFPKMLRKVAITLHSVLLLAEMFIFKGECFMPGALFLVSVCVRAPTLAWLSQL